MQSDHVRPAVICDSSFSTDELATMEIISRPKSAFATAISWTSFLIGLLGLGFIAWHIPTDRRGYVAVFESSEIQLPPLTRFMLAIPDIAFPAIAIAGALTMIAVQQLASAKNVAAVFHMFVISLSCLALVIYRESLFQPMSMLFRGLNGE